MVVGRIWLLSHDPDEQIAKAATALFQSKDLQLGWLGW